MPIHLALLSFRTAIFKLGYADQRGSAAGSQGSARWFPKIIIVCSVLNNLRLVYVFKFAHISQSLSQCIAWKRCPC